MIQALTDFTDPGSNSLQICSIPVMAHYNITSYIAGFQRRFPMAQLTVNEIEGVDILAELEQHHYDLAFARSDSLNETIFEKLPLYQDQMAVVLSTKHPLASEKEICLSQLSGEPFLQLSKNTMLLEPVLKICRDAGFEPQITYTGTRMENIIGLAGNQMGISLMMKQAAEYLKTSSIAIVPLREKIISEISLIRIRKHRYTPMAQNFWDYMKTR
jgi:DNA-binding transcriptional LysR family regulator